MRRPRCGRPAPPWRADARSSAACAIHCRSFHRARRESRALRVGGSCERPELPPKDAPSPPRTCCWRPQRRCATKAIQPVAFGRHRREVTDRRVGRAGCAWFSPGRGSSPLRWVSVCVVPLAAASCGEARLEGRRSRVCRWSRDRRPSGCDSEARDRRAALPQRHPSEVGGLLTRTRLRRACRLQRP